MGTNKLIEKLENFLSLSKKKQRKKHDKLLKIIRQLEKKRSKLEQKLKEETEVDANSSLCLDLKRELMVIEKLISKAQEKDLTI